jgi:hypothetical protein
MSTSSGLQPLANAGSLPECAWNEMTRGTITSFTARILPDPMAGLRETQSIVAKNKDAAASCRLLRGAWDGGRSQGAAYAAFLRRCIDFSEPVFDNLVLSSDLANCPSKESQNVAKLRAGLCSGVVGARGSRTFSCERQGSGWISLRSDRQQRPRSSY